MARLGYVAAVAGRSCLRRCAGSGQGPPSLSATDTRWQVRPLHFTRIISKDHDDGEKKAPTAAGTTPPDSPAGRAEGATASLPASTALARVGRGCLLALPLAGAGAAAWVGRSDYHKVRKELRLARVRLALDHMSHQREVSRTAGQSGAERPTQPTLDTSPARCYAVALLADAGVLAGHLVAAYGLYRGWDPEPIVNAEIASLIGALLSTGGAVRGEYLVAARMAAEVPGDEGSGDAGERVGGAGSGGGVASTGGATSGGDASDGGASKGSAGSGGASSGGASSDGVSASGGVGASGGAGEPDAGAQSDEQGGQRGPGAPSRYG